MKKEKCYHEWTRKEFEALPTPTSYTNQEVGEVDSLIILPEKYYHDSGYRCMSFVTIQKGKPTYKISGCSDVIHFGGIGGLNVRYYTGNLTYEERAKENKMPAVAWHIDCLPKSGLLRIFVIKEFMLEQVFQVLKYFLRRNKL